MNRTTRTRPAPHLRRRLLWEAALPALLVALAALALAGVTLP